MMDTANLKSHLIRQYFFSASYLNFVPGILVSSIWLLLPVPQIARVSLFVWSLPLFSAGAAHALHQGQDTLLQLFQRRCPMQGIILWLYLIVGTLFFFLLLMLANGIGLIGSAAGESIFVPGLIFLTAILLYRLWPNYLLHIIQPWPGDSDSWIGHGSLGLGPGPHTAWKYTRGADLPRSITLKANVALLTIIASVFALFLDRVQDLGVLYIPVHLLIVAVILPAAHIWLTHAGYLLLSANQIELKTLQKRPTESSAHDIPPPAKPRPAVWDDQAIINDSVYAILGDQIIITGWLFTRRDRREWNVVVGYNEVDDMLGFVDGPNSGGHWGHEADYREWEPKQVLMDWFPDNWPIPQANREKIIRFLNTRA